MNTEYSPNSPKKFICELCGYICRKQSDFDKHSLTRKHVNNYNSLQKMAKCRQKNLSAYVVMNINSDKDYIIIKKNVKI